MCDSVFVRERGDRDRQKTKNVHNLKFTLAFLSELWNVVLRALGGREGSGMCPSEKEVNTTGQEEKTGVKARRC